MLSVFPVTVIDDGSPAKATAAEPSISFYFSAGDFAEAVRRYRSGRSQVYGTHNEVAKLLGRLEADGYRVTVHSFVTAEASEESIGKLNFRNLGGQQYNDNKILEAAFVLDTSDITIVHLANITLLRAAAASAKRVFAILASSYNKGFFRGFAERREIAHVLNAPGIELVANHCMPSTRRLRDLGVHSDRLCAWDVPHGCNPADNAEKQLAPGGHYTIAFVGSVVESKGIFDLVRAVALLARADRNVSLHIAGSGDTNKVRALAESLGIGDRVAVLGQISNDRVLELFRTSTIAAIPSHHDFPEGFPLTMFEAIASRTPILCSDHPVFADLRSVEDGVLTVPQKNPEAISRAVSALLDNPGRYAAISANALVCWQIATGATDWGTLIYRWVTEGSESVWIKMQTLAALGI